MPIKHLWNTNLYFILSSKVTEWTDSLAPTIPGVCQQASGSSSSSSLGSRWGDAVITSSVSARASGSSARLVLLISRLVTPELSPPQGHHCSVSILTSSRCFLRRRFDFQLAQSRSAAAGGHASVPPEELTGSSRLSSVCVWRARFVRQIVQKCLHRLREFQLRGQRSGSRFQRRRRTRDWRGSRIKNTTERRRQWGCYSGVLKEEEWGAQVVRSF